MLFEKFPTLELADEPAQRPTFVLRGYETISVTVR
jgi:cytochrome P450